MVRTYSAYRFRVHTDLEHAVIVRNLYTLGRNVFGKTGILAQMEFIRERYLKT